MLEFKELVAFLTEEKLVFIACHLVRRCAAEWAKIEFSHTKTTSFALEFIKVFVQLLRRVRKTYIKVTITEFEKPRPSVPLLAFCRTR